MTTGTPVDVIADGSEFITKWYREDDKPMSAPEGDGWRLVSVVTSNEMMWGLYRRAAAYTFARKVKP